MSKGLTFNKTPDQQSQGLPMYSDTCGLPGCKNETAHAQMIVTGPRGREIRVASEVLTSEKKPWVLKEGYSFVSWWTRCSECLQNGIRNKQAKMRMNGEL